MDRVILANYRPDEGREQAVLLIIFGIIHFLNHSTGSIEYNEIRKYSKPKHFCPDSTYINIYYHNPYFLWCYCF